MRQFIYLPTGYSKLVEQLLDTEQKWTAPILWKSEFRSVLSGYLRKELLDFYSSIAIMQEAEDLMANQEYQISSLQVFKLVSEFNCSAYDCEFVALSKQLGVSLVTQDKKILLDFPQTAHSLDSFLQKRFKLMITNILY